MPDAAISDTDRGVSTLTLSLVVAAVMLVLLGAFLLLRRSTPAPPAAPPAARPPLSPEQKAYLQFIEITEPRMSAAQNFLGDTITMLDARITNKGAKEVRHLDLELTFVDTLNQVVLRETARPLSARSAPLKPGETRALHLSFEHIPPDWNQAVPLMRATYIQF